MILCAIGVSRHERAITKPATVVAVACVSAVLFWRLFPDPGRFPFPAAELVAALLFCVGGFALTWRVERARILRALFATYAAVCLIAYVVPSDVGDNVARLRFAAIPIAVLTLSLRRWRPWPVAVIAVALACSWNLSPLIWGLVRSTSDPSASAAYWQPVVNYPARRAHAGLSRRGRRHDRPLGGRLPRRGPGSRSCAAGSGRTTSRRTRCCTTAPGRARTCTWLHCTRRALRRADRRARRTTAPAPRRCSCAAAIPGCRWCTPRATSPCTRCRTRRRSSPARPARAWSRCTRRRSICSCARRGATASRFATRRTSPRRARASRSRRTG